MEAKLGYRPSYVWRSLLAARDVILEGTQWRVGDGTKIEVSSLRWLSHKPVFMGEEMLSAKVSEFIDTNTWQWNRLKVCETFAPRTRKEILAIPLNRSCSRDCLIWKENRRHEFTVKSTYQVALCLNQQVEAEHSKAQEDRKWWKKIWALKVPPKVKTFLWRACSNILPTRDNLFRRKIQIDPICELCSQTRETCDHLLWECPFARNVWAMMKGKVQKCRIFFIFFDIWVTS